jgi:hypothetical protein
MQDSLLFDRDGRCDSRQEAESSFWLDSQGELSYLEYNLMNNLKEPVDRRWGCWGLGSMDHLGDHILEGARMLALWGCRDLILGLCMGCQTCLLGH